MSMDQLSGEPDAGDVPSGLPGKNKSYMTLFGLHDFMPVKTTVGGGFKYFLFSPLFWEMIQFD